MTARSPLRAGALFFFVPICVRAQGTVIRDPEIESMVREVSPDSLQSYIKSMVSFGTRSTVSSTTDPKRGIGAARNWVLSKFNEFAAAAHGRMSAFVDTSTYASDGRRVTGSISLGNTVATLKGTDPQDKRIFIISGHLDSRRTDVMDGKNDAPGANDDGSGSAAVLECARIMSKHGFPATIIFVTVSGEEQGLLGSAYMAKKAKAEGWNIGAVLNNDIMGSNNSNETNIINNTQVRVFSEGLPAYQLDSRLARAIRQLGLENDSRSRQLARYVKETGERYVDNLEVVLVYRPDRFLRGGDHIPYLDSGFAAVRITEMNENFNHQHQDIRVEKGVQYGDLAEFMDFEYLRKNTALNLCNLANLAKAPGVPEAVKVEVRGLGNGTQLSWKAPLSGKPRGYYILMRETSSAVWQKKIFTAGTSIDLPYSKDNYFFAVQSVSDGGNESLPVVPMPDSGR
ncbi:MAG: M20/M25/M40 family metallo-hydrolase [Bacteroidota bacterium]|nr:M20/M25/M40 family metallo-hydrolase [Bacteroidota bacterium]